MLQRSKKQCKTLIQKCGQRSTPSREPHHSCTVKIKGKLPHGALERIPPLITQLLYSCPTSLSRGPTMVLHRLGGTQESMVTRSTRDPRIHHQTYHKCLCGFDNLYFTNKFLAEILENSQTPSDQQDSSYVTLYYLHHCHIYCPNAVSSLREHCTPHIRSVLFY